jgi:DNA-binding MarR family transcriptional regulator
LILFKKDETQSEQIWLYGDPDMQQNEKTTKRKEICNDVLIAIRRIIQSIDLHSRYLVRYFGLTVPQLTILQDVSSKGEVSVSDIAKAVSLGQPTVTGILERLENRGLISRRRSQSDKRKIYISVTDAGIQILKKAPPPMQEHFIDSFISLHDWEQSMILSSLQRIVTLMDAKNIEVSPILAEAGPISEASEKLWEQQDSSEGDRQRDKLNQYGKEKPFIEAETKFK